MKKWQAKCDKLVKKIALSKGMCERCGRSDHQLHHHHIFTRNNFAYRHDLMNIVTLCAGCHNMRADSVHSDITTFRKWMKECQPWRWEWYIRHTVRTVETIAGQEVEKYSPIKKKHIGDQEEYVILKELLKGTD
jgi:hypothetical protein